jgi:hypothetical protein
VTENVGRALLSSTACSQFKKEKKKFITAKKAFKFLNVDIFYFFKVLCELYNLISKNLGREA